MNSQLKRLTSKRVADFFVSVNAGIDLIQAKDSQNSNITGQAYHDITELYFSPNVTGRYPLTDRLNQQLPDGLTRFCFPNEIQLSDHSKRTTFHTFVLTSEGGARLLGCCLIYYRKVDAEQAVFLEKLQSEIPGLRPRNDIRSLYLPYCVCLISHWTFVHQFKTVMCCLHQISLTASTTPIERYICNFIDDVPAPPAGRIDVTYYLGEQAISFRCPPANEPNVWSGMPLFPLFECLSPENILALFTCVLVERQIIFVSSQYSLLTVCAEAITSLLYPITWSHAYIPILPKFLVTFVTAPFPYITGIHTSYWSSVDQSACEDAVKVFLDENRIDFGDLGAPPALPDRRARKLLQSICSAGRVFELRGDTWQEDRRPFFDDAFSTISDRPVSSIIKSEKLDESLRAAFLKFFVTLLKNYRRHLVYGSMMNKFSFEEFLAEQGTESRPFLEEMLQTQQFSEFVDSRLFEVGRDPDVVFFDESIDAKQNRKTFKLRGNIDTPFLDNVDSKHQKTYVAPSPDISNCPIEGPYLYPNGLGNLNASLYSAPRNLTPPLNSGVSTSMMHLARLKRANTSFLGSGYVGPQSAFASTYSCYIVTLSRLICYTQSHLFEFKAAARTSVQQIIEEYGNEDDMDNSTHHSEVSFDTGRIDLRAIESALVDKLDTTAQIESLLNQSQDAAPEDQQAVIDALIASPLSSPFTASGLKTSRDKHTISVIISPRDNESIIDDDTAHMEPSPLIRSNSIVTRQSRTSTLGGRKRSESSSTQQDDKDLMEAAKLALRVSLEALNCLSRLDEPADDAVFRSLAEACGCCGFAQE